jgi:hypothetical protein
MIYGEHTGLVQEVADFVCSGRILSGPSTITDQAVVIETGFDDAMQRAWSQDMPEGQLTWKDIRSQEMSKVYAKSYTFPDFPAIDKELIKLPEFFYRCLRRVLPKEFHEIMDEIIGDLYSCAFARAVDGKGSSFFEKLLKVYRDGGWPCGWEGAYPDGRLIVYLPFA